MNLAAHPPPELHSVHHQLDVHHYNYADIPLWDRLFGTYRDADDFVAECGFPRHNERKLGRMLAFRNVYHDEQLLRAAEQRRT